MAWLGKTSVLGLIPSILLGACDLEDKDPGDPEALNAPDADDDASGDPPTPRPQSNPLCEPDTWDGFECTTEDGEQSRNFCIIVDGEELYTPCTTEVPECTPGDGMDYGCFGEICYWDGEAFRYYTWDDGGDCETPLVVSFDAAPLDFTPAVAEEFDLSTDGTCTSTDWPSAPWLALDRDGDGLISDGSELFGSATKLSSGGRAEHGFAALAELDSDRDGKITAADARFGELVLWSDLDEDRIGTSLELRLLRETELVAIDLGFDRRASCDDYGNCGFERASFEYQTSVGLALGEVVDVHLACR